MKHPNARVPSLPEILLSIQPPSTPWKPTEPTAALSNFLQLHQISSRHSEQQNTGAEQQRDKEHGAYLLSMLLFVCNLRGKKKNQTNKKPLCIYSFNYFRSQLPPEAGFGKHATRASHFAFISQQFSSWPWLSSKAWHEHSSASVCPAVQLKEPVQTGIFLDKNMSSQDK